MRVKAAAAGGGGEEEHADRYAFDAATSPAVPTLCISSPDDPIVTTLEEPIHFFIAEKKHHDYFARNPYQGYCAGVVGPKIAKVRAMHAHLYR